MLSSWLMLNWLKHFSQNNSKVSSRGAVEKPLWPLLNSYTTQFRAGL